MLIRKKAMEVMSRIGVRLTVCSARFVWKLGLMMVTIKFAVFLVGIYMVYHVSKSGCSSKEVRESARVRVLYASQLHAVDEELQKCTDWCKKEVEWRRREAELHKQVEHLTKKEFQIDGDRQPSGMGGQHMLNKRRCFQGLRALADLHKMRSSATIPGTTPSNHATIPGTTPSNHATIPGTTPPNHV